MKLPTSKQVFIGIWLHDKMFPEGEQAKMKYRLNCTFYYNRVFDEIKQFTTYIDKSRLVAKVFLIISTTIDYSFIWNITTKRPEFFRCIYVFLPPYLTTIPSTFNEEVFTDMINLFQRLSTDIMSLPNSNPPNNTRDRFEKQLLPPMSTMHSKCVKDTHIHHLDKETLQFLCFLAMTNIFLNMTYSKEELEVMLMHCRKCYPENNAQLDHIDNFDKNYESRHAIKCYTANKCLFRIVNKAFANESIKDIFPFRIYITDLHKQLDELHKNKQPDNTVYPIKVYRGKMLSGSVLQQLIDNKGGFICMNGFLSTTSNDEIGIIFAGDENARPDYNSVLFEIYVDKNMKQPFADIAHLSDIPDEAEVLFSFGTIWKIELVQREVNKWKVHLKSCDELDSNLIGLVEKQYTNGNCTFHSLGDLLYNVGNDDDAEFFYNKMLKQRGLSNESQAILLHQIGMIRFRNNDFTVAIERMEKVLEKMDSIETVEIEPASCRPLYVPFGLPSSRTIYHNIGLMYQMNDDYREAFEHYEKALIKEGNDLELATVHNSIGLLDFLQKKYRSAVEHHEEALRLIDNNHPHLPEFRYNLERAQKRHQHVLTRQTTTNEPNIIPVN